MTYERFFKIGAPLAVVATLVATGWLLLKV